MFCTNGRAGFSEMFVRLPELGQLGLSVKDLFLDNNYRLTVLIIIPKPLLGFSIFTD